MTVPGSPPPSLPWIERLDTPRLSLRPVGLGDLDALFEVNGDPLVTRLLPYEHWHGSADAEQWLSRMQALQATGSGQQLVLERRAGGALIGTLLVFRHDAGSARVELGYVLGRNHWGQGLMTETVRAFCDHAFGPMALRRIEAEVHVANGASARLLEGVGFRHEGRMRERWVAKGLAYDTDFYGLLAADWREARGVVD